MSTPANNFFGHGFYQFSPELMFRIFGPENGFRYRTVQWSRHATSPELTRNRVAYEVADPAQVHRRVGLVTKRPVIMMVEARKAGSPTPVRRAPLQSELRSAWSRRRLRQVRDSQAPSSRRTWRSRVHRHDTAALHVLHNGWAQRQRFSLANRQFYTASA